MKKNKKRIGSVVVIGLGALSLFFVLAKCSSDTGGATITDNVTAMASIPSADPANMDYSLQASSRGINYQSNIAAIPGESLEIQVKLQHVPGSGLGTFNLWQCRNGTFMGYASYSVANDLYSGTVYYRETDGLISGGEDNTVDIVSAIKAGSITASDFTGSVDFKFHDVARIVITADGATQSNLIQAAKSVEGFPATSIACKWNATLGCAQKENQTAIPFAISADATTKEKTFSATADQTMCDGLTFTTVADNYDLTSSSNEYWDCSLPSRESWTNVGSPAALEDAGGEDCLAKTDHWESADSDPSSCGDGTGVSSIGCFCNALYSVAVQKIRRAQRQFTCKTKGIFKKVQAGTLTDVSFGEGSTLYLKASFSR